MEIGPLEIGLLLMFLGACCLRLARRDDYCYGYCPLMKRPIFPASETDLPDYEEEDLLDHDEPKPFVIDVDSNELPFLIGAQLPNRPRLHIVK
ncbi:MAG: hypothetical protein AB1424_01885 [Thermodesulfobacteriota bacterium]